MTAIKSAAQIAQKWARVTPQRTADYEQGVRSPRKSWAEATGNAVQAYEQGIQESISKGRFAAGVAAAGDEKWKKKTIEKGVRRWGPGVQVAQSDFEAGFAPYRQVIEGVELPPRYPKGDPRNLERVAAITSALHAAKVGS